MIFLFLHQKAMGSNKYQLAIDNPCFNNTWASMPKEEKGRHCAVCIKTVVDFADWNEEAIISYLNQKNEPVCGRLTHRQLNRIIENKKTTTNPIFYRIGGLFLLLAAAGHASAGTEKTICPGQVISYDIDTGMSACNNSTISNRRRSAVAQTDSSTNIIAGVVIEAYTEKPVPSATVYVKGTRTKTETDSLGNFEIVLPDNYPEQEIMLVVKANGWESDTEITVSRGALPVKDLVIKKKAVVVGEIQIVRYRKKQWWQFWKGKR
ncbi:carboxypeptidase-like regulatory domain-containing protein [Niabella sp. CC-SYL272]|uniref:carboxypeptidase-like regulatory domain-containing protein n=1 Tax=Niabella agricola TaxID=2891571 RepID=UPI001F19AEA8|nr:carboxypeptidase-like regulatory domain-containing protein [Niabella agricola]MCF3107735.1 carboxypeptidase-like regulatory domain-containing protein [Niabella agricola]